MSDITAITVITSNITKLKLNIFPCHNSIGNLPSKLPLRLFNHLALVFISNLLVQKMILWSVFFFVFLKLCSNVHWHSWGICKVQCLDSCPANKRILKAIRKVNVKIPIALRRKKMWYTQRVTTIISQQKWVGLHVTSLNTL